MRNQNLIKSFVFGNNYRYNLIVRAVQCDSNENVYLAGYIPKEYTAGVNLGNGRSIAKDNYFLAKYSPQGECLWAKVIKGHFSQGEARPYGSFMITLDKENNLYLYHDTDVNYTIDNMTYTIAPVNTVNGVLTKYNSEGTIQWIRKLYDYENGLNTFTLPLLKNLKIDSQNNIIGVFEMQEITNVLGRQVVGGLEGGIFKTTQMVLAKLDNNFNLTWFKFIGKYPSMFSYGLNVDNSDNILLNYYEYSRWGIVSHSSNLSTKYNPAGNVIWEKNVRDFIFSYDGSSVMGHSFTTHKLNTLNPLTNHLLCFGTFYENSTLKLEDN